MLIRSDIAGFIKNNAGADAFADQDAAVENIAVIDLRRNADDSGRHLFRCPYDGRIAGIGNIAGRGRLGQLLYRSLVRAVGGEENVVNFKSSGDADGNQYDPYGGG